MVSDLLIGLHSRYPDGIPSGPDSTSNVEIPEDPSHVRIAKLHDNTNSDKGWSEIPWVKHEDDKLKNCLKGWKVEGGAKLAFTFTSDVEAGRLRELSEAEEEEMVKEESPDFWVEWPNFEWMDQEVEDEEDAAKRLRDEEEDGEVPAREKRRRIVDDDEDDDELMDPRAASAMAEGYRR